MEALPFVALALIAQWGREEPARKRIVTGLMVFSSMVVFALGTLVFLGGFIGSFFNGKENNGALAMGLWLLAAAILTGLTQVAVFRRFLRWFMPGDLESTGQIIGLWVVVFGLLFFVGLGSSFNILGWLSSMPEDQLSAAMDMDPLTVLAGGIAFPIIALFGAGFPLKRNLRQVMQRLKLQKVRKKHWAWIVGFALIGLILDALFSALSQLLPGGSNPEVEKIVQQMSGGAHSTWLQILLLALAVGVTAGVGEELLFRGLLQPRFGNLITSIFFASLHLQYGFNPVLLQLVVWSLVLGYVRNKTNTTVTILAHGLYDFLAVLLSGLG